MKYSYLICRKNKQSIFLNVDLNTTDKFTVTDIQEFSKKIVIDSNVVFNASEITGKLVGFKNKKPAFTQDTYKKFQANSKLVTVLAIIGVDKAGFLICDETGKIISISSDQLKKMRTSGYKFTNISEDLKLSLNGFEEGKDIPIIKTRCNTRAAITAAQTDTDSKRLTRDEALKLIISCAPKNLRHLINAELWYILSFTWLDNLKKVKDKFENSEISFEKITNYLEKVFLTEAEFGTFKEQVLNVFETDNYSLKDIKL